MKLLGNNQILIKVILNLISDFYPDFLMSSIKTCPTKNDFQIGQFILCVQSSFIKLKSGYFEVKAQLFLVFLKVSNHQIQLCWVLALVKKN
jgi:hypothetical protein